MWSKEKKKINTLVSSGRGAEGPRALYFLMDYFSYQQILYLKKYLIKKPKGPGALYLPFNGKNGGKKC